ncbi:MAG: V-type ATP synthase subunit E [Planctomycetota bacterium]
MSLEEIKEEVLSNARKEAQAIINRASAERDKKLKEAKSTEDKRFQKTFESKKAELEKQLSNELANLRQDIKVSILREKNKVIDKVLSIALGKLEELPEKQLTDTLIKYLKALPDEISGEVALSSQDASKYGSIIIQEANRSRTKGKFSGPVSDQAVQSGLRVKSSGYEIDLTFATKISELKSEIIPVVAKKLFKEEEKQSGSS